MKGLRKNECDGVCELRYSGMMGCRKILIRIREDAALGPWYTMSPWLAPELATSGYKTIPSQLASNVN